MNLKMKAVYHFMPNFERMPTVKNFWLSYLNTVFKNKEYSTI